MAIYYQYEIGCEYKGEQKRANGPAKHPVGDILEGKFTIAEDIQELFQHQH